MWVTNNEWLFNSVCAFLDSNRPIYTVVQTSCTICIATSAEARSTMGATAMGTFVLERPCINSLLPA